MSSKEHINLTPTAAWAEGRIVKRSGVSGCALATKPALADGEQIMGVMEQAAISGVPQSVVMFGHTFGRAGGVITAGTHSKLTTDDEGRFVPASAGDQVVALFTGVKSAVLGARIPVFVIIGAMLPGAGAESFAIVVGDEAANMREVALQALDANGLPLAAERDVALRLCTAFQTQVSDMMVAELAASVGTQVSGDGFGGLFRTNAAGQLTLSVTEKNGAALTFYLDIIHRHGGVAAWVTLAFAAD